MCDCMSNYSFLNFYLYDLQIKSHWATNKRFYYRLYTKIENEKCVTACAIPRFCISESRTRTEKRHPR